MIRLDDLALFLRSAALGGFSAAAREAGLLPAQVSAAIQRLERELGIRLFARSTRSLRLTAEGESYLPHAQEALEAQRAGRDRVRGGTDSVLRGVLQIAAPSDFGRNVMLPWITQFRRQHPELVLRVSFSDRVTDLFRDPVDAAVRYGVKASASFVALPLAPGNRRILVASPTYVARRGAPRVVEDLGHHDCLIYTINGRAHEWSFSAPGGPLRTVTVRGIFESDDGEIVRRLALSGEGIAYKSALDVGADLRSGSLVQLLPDLAGEPAPLHLVTSHRRQYSPALQAMHAMLRRECEALSPGR